MDLFIYRFIQDTRMHIVGFFFFTKGMFCITDIESVDIKMCARSMVLLII